MKWPEAFTDLVGCRAPLQQAGMGGVTTPALAAAVAREGGLGMIAAAGMAADDVVAQVTAARDSAGEGARIGVNFLMPFFDEQVFERAAGVANLVEFFYGDPRGDIVDRAHRFGALAAWQVGSVAEAEEAAGAGCDVIVVQGREAGGHVRGQTSLLPLLDAVRACVDRPIVAAGGIGSGRAMAAAWRAGADAVRIGTRLVATTEADVHPAYADALVDAADDDTVLTETFAMGWPNAPHRVLRSCVEASTDDPSSRSPLPPTRMFADDVAAAAMYAGTSVSDVRAVESATTVVRGLLRDAEAAMAEENI